MALLLALLLIQDGSLVDRLGHDDPDVRDAAYEALRQQGSTAAPLLRTALKHPSAEVRARVADLLERLPEYRGRFLRRHPEYARAARIWKGLIDGVIHRKPIPAALWKEIGDPTIHHAQPLICSADPVVPHPEAWILARLAEAGAADLRWLGQKYGVAGLEEELLVPKQEGARKKLPADLFLRLAALHPDWETLEEVYGTLLILRIEGLGAWSDWMADRDWDTVLLFLTTLRLRPNAKPAEPLTSEESIRQLCRGPWIRGLARGLGRAFSNTGQTFARSTCTVPQVSLYAPESSWRDVIFHYNLLLEIERDVSRRWFWKDRLRPARARTPEMPTDPAPDEQDPAFTYLRTQTLLEGPEAATAATLLKGVNPNHWAVSNLEFLAEISRQVSAAARKESR